MAGVYIENGRLPDNAFRFPERYREVTDTKTYRQMMLVEQGRVLACGEFWRIIGRNLGGGVWEVTLRKD